MKHVLQGIWEFAARYMEAFKTAWSVRAALDWQPSRTCRAIDYVLSPLRQHRSESMRER